MGAEAISLPRTTRARRVGTPSWSQTKCQMPVGMIRGVAHSCSMVAVFVDHGSTNPPYPCRSQLTVSGAVTAPGAVWRGCDVTKAASAFTGT